jgi:hypothetical protein
LPDAAGAEGSMMAKTKVTLLAPKENWWLNNVGAKNEIFNCAVLSSRIILFRFISLRTSKPCSYE